MLLTTIVVTVSLSRLEHHGVSLLTLVSTCQLFVQTTTTVKPDNVFVHLDKPGALTITLVLMSHHVVLLTITVVTV